MGGQGNIFNVKKKILCYNSECKGKAGIKMETKVFGEKLQDKEYHDREAAYVVLTDGELFAVVKTRSGKLFLP